MSYIGNVPTNVAFLTDQFNGNGSLTAFTLSAAPANTNSILVAVSGVLQDPTTYSVSGTTLTFSAAPPAGTGNISVRFLGIPASGVTTTAYRTQTEFTATAGQTTFSVPSYTVGFIDVYRNGALLGSADFTATNGTTVVLANAASAGDLIETVSFYVSSVLNAIPATAGAVTDSYILSMAGSKLTGSQSIPKATLPSGSVLQVVGNNSLPSVQFTTTSLSYVTWAAAPSATITLINPSSRVLISARIGMQFDAGDQIENTIYRIISGGSTTDLSNGNTYGLSFHGTSFSGGLWKETIITWIDTPSTASAITYTWYARSESGGLIYPDHGNAANTITLTEIAP